MIISHCTGRRELEEVVDLCDRSFPNTAREYFERHILHDDTLRPEETLIGRVEGKIVSSVQIFPRACRVEAEIVRFGGLGNVATDPEVRRSGYAAALILEAHRRMSERGFAFSLLTTGINAYYEKFGYVTIPCEAFLFAATSVTDARWRIRAYEPERDDVRVMELYQLYNADAVGPLERDEMYWRAQSRFSGEDPSMFLVAEGSKGPAGYIRGKPNKGALQVLEFAAQGDSQALFAVLVSALAAGHPGIPVRLLLSEREQRRLSPLPPHRVEPDTEFMILPLDETYRTIVQRKFLKPGSFMFWRSDAF